MKLNDLEKALVLLGVPKAQFVPGSAPIPVPASPGRTELALSSTHSYGYGSQSRPALSPAWPAPSSGMLVKYAG